ncbi:ABC transporter permease [Agrococcus sp. SCSIO52902]|uniref:ABC transporter permease n=1 Tax=Agrococcus sp. SCSIO52902 TaxID=2933290 RepID=UPI001FF35B94|nr:ABC transporter permease [Agrococcus sp. SCSIO52902]UOW00971.1 ABC transporter permease [Agrococcus sp. SCSIO52902]
MATFIVRRLIAAVLILLAATFLMYNMVAFSGDPLEDLRGVQTPQTAQLIEARIRLLHLDVPPPLRYFIWLGGIGGCFIGQCDFGMTIQQQPVLNVLLNSMDQTLRLVTIATIVAIILGIVIGITTALRQYSSYDYGVTFISFLFFSLPIFWFAVLLKQFLAIGANDWLQTGAQIDWWVIVVVALVSGLFWMSVLGGDPKRKAITFALGTLAGGLVLGYMSMSGWFLNPRFILFGLDFSLLAIAFLMLSVALIVTAILAGIKNRRSLMIGLGVAAVGIALYYPVNYFLFNPQVVPMNFWILAGLAVVTILVGVGAGWVFGGDNKSVNMKIGGWTAFLVGAIMVVDRHMQLWQAYSQSGYIRGRPIATIGASNPGFSQSSFFVQGVDAFTHLLLPTIALMVISFAGYTRYTRASLLEVLNQDYIRTARAKGLTERTVIVRHAFRNALIPITTIVAFDIAGIIGGAVITERVFGWTGMGSMFINGLNQVDPNPVMAFFLVTGALALLFNMLADIAYAALDPRIRVS